MTDTPLSKFLTEHRIGVTFVERADRARALIPGATVYVCTVAHGGRSFSTDYTRSIFQTVNAIPPDPANAFECLLTDATFGDAYRDDPNGLADALCEDDPREARRILTGCKRTHRELVRVLGDDLYAEALDVER